MAPEAGPGRGNGPAPLPTVGASKASGSNPWIQFFRGEIASSSASLIATVATFPLDSIKTRMQTYKYAGVLDCVKHTYRTEQLRGFFRGVLAPMATISLARTVSISLFSRSKVFYSNMIYRQSGFDPMAHVTTQGTYPNLYTLACFGLAGATAGTAISVVACPFELTKLSAQVSVLLADRKNTTDRKAYEVAASYHNKGTFKTMANIVRHRGFMGLYTGFKLHCVRDTLGTAIYFMVYESSKQLTASLSSDWPAVANGATIFLSGGLCGAVSLASMYPIDCAKSIYQKNSLMYSKGQKVKPAPKIEFFKRHMYRGLSVSLARSFVVNAIFLSTYEFLQNHLKSVD